MDKERTRLALDSVTDSDKDRPRSMTGVDGSDPAWVAMFRQLDRVLDVPCPVLLTGPHGVGKHVTARALHQNGCGSRGPFVWVDCQDPEQPARAPADEHISGVSSTLEADETVVVRPAQATRRFGTASSPEEWVRAAAGGTLYVDEITGLPPHAQVALAAALRQDGTAAPRFRLVCASRIAAEQLVGTRLLREDFFYLASVVSCAPPLLRSRRDDVLLLAQMFLEETARRLGREVDDIGPAARRLLTSYRWPGNVSELRSVMEHAVAVSRDAKLEPADLPAHVRDVGAEGERSSGHGEIQLPAEGLDLRRTLEALENTLLQQALDRTGWNKQRAAALLGLNRTTLVEMLKRKRMSRPTSERKMAS